MARSETFSLFLEGVTKLKMMGLTERGRGAHRKKPKLGGQKKAKNLISWDASDLLPQGVGRMEKTVGFSTHC